MTDILSLIGIQISRGYTTAEHLPKMQGKELQLYRK